LHDYIGKIFHVYLDDIVIWSDSIEQHFAHLHLIMDALCAAKLFCNPKKCKFFVTKFQFLGHQISHCGIEANNNKVQHILEWPMPTSCKDMCSFLGLICYITVFLPQLAEHTTILTPLTNKEARTHFPAWTNQHQMAFDNIK